MKWPCNTCCPATLGSSLNCATASKSAFQEEQSLPAGHAHAQGAGTQQRGGWRLLLHAAPQDLVGRNQHDAYDEGHGEGADEALPDAGLSVLFLGMH